MGLPACQFQAGRFPFCRQAGIWPIKSKLFTDEKLKENIQSLQNGLDRLMKPDVKTFNYKASEFPELNLPAYRQDVFLAQNLESVFPELEKNNPA
jgi:hypothetical protein